MSHHPTLGELELYADLCEASYVGVGAVSATFTDHGSAATAVEVRKGPSQAFVGVCSDEIFVVCTGSNSWCDWADNIRYLFPQRWRELPRESGKVHRGFRRHVDRVLSAVLAMVAVAAKARGDQPGYVVTVLGQSLGGSMSTLIAAALYVRGYTVRHVFPEASPRVGDEQFQAWYDERLRARTHRVLLKDEDVRDPVPSVPPRAAGYRHVGQAWTLRRDRGRWILYPAIQDVPCTSGLLAPFVLAFCKSIRAHSPKLYAAGMRAYRKRLVAPRGGASADARGGSALSASAGSFSPQESQEATP